MIINHTVNIDGLDYEVEFEVYNIKTVKGGIGGYEFWGYRGTDWQEELDAYDIGIDTVVPEGQDAPINFGDGRNNDLLLKIQDELYDSQDVIDKIFAGLRDYEG